jgi:hypothetical protein
MTNNQKLCKEIQLYYRKYDSNVVKYYISLWDIHTKSRMHKDSSILNNCKLIINSFISSYSNRPENINILYNNIYMLFKKELDKVYA